METLIGELVLKNGQSVLLGVSNAETRFSEYLVILSQLAADKQRVKDLLGEDIEQY